MPSSSTPIGVFGPIRCSDVTPRRVVLLLLSRMYFLPGLSPLARQRLGFFLIQKIILRPSLNSGDFSSIAKPCTFSDVVEELLGSKKECDAAGDEDEVVSTLKKQCSILSSNHVELSEFFTQMYQLVDLSTFEKDDEETFIETFRRSPLGLFCRSVCLAYQTLPFSGVFRLLRALRSYLGMNMEEDGDASSGGDGISGIFVEKLSLGDTERLIKSVGKRILESVGSRSSSETQDLIDRLRGKVSGESVCHYLTYINCVAHRDYHGAIESLHRYFDHSVDERDALALGAMVAGGSQFPSVAPMGDTPSALPYAVLKVAETQYVFGRLEAATQSLHETIRTAQERNDHRCLAHALFWIAKLAQRGCSSKKSRASKDRELGLLLERTVVRASTLDLPDVFILSSAALASFKATHSPFSAHAAAGATHPLRRGGNHRGPRAASEGAGDDSHHDPSCSSTWGPPDVWRHLSEARWAASKHDEPNLMGSTLLVRSACWEAFGNADLASLSLEAFQRHYACDGARPQDIIAANALSITRLSQRGAISRAISHMVHSRAVHEAGDGLWGRTAARALQRWFCSRGLYALSRVAQDELTRLARARRIPEDVADARACACALSLSRGWNSRALREARSLLAYTESHGMYTMKIRVLLLLVRAHMQAGNHCGGLPLAFAALAQSARVRAMRLWCRAGLLLARMQFELGRADKADGILQHLLPQVYHHCSCEAQAQARTLLAECMMARSWVGHHSHEDVGKIQHLLDEALRQYTILGDLKERKRCLYLLAVFHHKCEDIEQRDGYSTRFSRLEQQYTMKVNGEQCSPNVGGKHIMRLLDPYAHDVEESLDWLHEVLEVDPFHEEEEESQDEEEYRHHH